MPTKCPKCDSANTSDSKFCKECGTQLIPTQEVPEVTKTLETPVQDLTRGTKFAGRYQIVEKLGTGGMGSVYRVEDTKIHEDIALKLIRPDIAADKKTIDRFSNELKLARKIRHKNVCQMFDLGETEGTHFITMEYVTGEDLKSFIRRSKQISIPTAISITNQVCAGLAEAHKLGIVHRDLKPSNIMIDKAGNACIMDFGIARSTKAETITRDNVIVGTPDYMSPEQVEGKEIDQRSDIYSLGVILYEMATGRVPFEGDTALSVAMKHKSEIPKSPKEYNAQIPEDLSNLILKCLEKDMESRFQSAGEVRTELVKIEKGIPTTERIVGKQKSLVPKGFTKSLKKRWVAISVLLLMIIGIGFILSYLKLGNPTLFPDERKLVVLPFENLGSPVDEYFADGITAEITARLNSINQLDVIARTSAMQYKKTEKSIQVIGQDLGVSHILTGTVRWQRTTENESRVRITPTLVRVSDGTQVWAESYEEMFTDVFQIQSEIAKQVASALNIILPDSERKILETIPTNNPEAYDYYLQGNQYYYYGSIEKKDLYSSIEMFERAIELDPNFVQAYNRLTIAHGSAYWEHFDHTEERILKAKQSLDKAIQLAPDLPETHLASGIYHYYCKLDYEKALSLFEIVLEKQPKNSEALAYIGYVQRRQGNFKYTISYLKKALEVDPRSSLTAYNIGFTLYFIGNYEEAEYFYNKAISLNPDFIHPYAHKAELYLYWKGDTKMAREVLEEVSKNRSSLDEHLIDYPWILVDIFDGNYQEALNRLSLVHSEAFQYETFFIPKAQLYAQIYGLMGAKQKEQEYYNLDRVYLESKIKEHPDDSRLYSALGIAYAGLGDKEKAILEAERAAELIPISKEALKGFMRVRDLALVFVMVGEYEKALDQIEYLLNIPGYLSVPFLRLDPSWAPLKEHPRFQKLVG